MDPLSRYRQAQRQARELFDPFTRAHCPTCATPCCMKPARIQPVDLILVQELGYSLPRRADDAAAVAGGLALATLGGGARVEEPCDYLGTGGCVFPADLRPFGCTAFVCEPMRRLLPPGELSRIEEAIRGLEGAHRELMAALHAVSATEEHRQPGQHHRREDVEPIQPDDERENDDRLPS